MSQKKPPARAARGPTIPALRAKIDRIDRDLLKLMNERAQLAVQIGHLKQADGEPAYDPLRESEVLGNVASGNKGPLPERCVQNVFRELMSGARSLEKKMVIAYLGPDYSYSHLAAMHQFGQSVQQAPVATIATVFEEVMRGHANYGVVPLENSTDGRVADTLEQFTRFPVKICGEVQLWIHHHLLAKCPRSEIREVYSRTQALSQCRNWLAKHLPAARPVEVTSTSTAAQLAADKQGAAAISSRQAGLHYGLEVIAENIEDNRANLTRFAVIGHKSSPRTGKDRTALMFEIHHKPGALADATAVFKRNRLNMTWIESFPIPRPEGGYMFFIEVEGHESDSRLKHAIETLEKRTVQFRVLGSYPRATPVD